MIKNAIVLLFAAFPVLASASPAAPMSVRDYCALHADHGRFQDLLKDPKNRLSFTNGRYGLQSGGVCWWHNKFERNAAYLAVYRPDLPKPSRQEALSLISEIRRGRRVIRIPGYANLREFSIDYKREIIRKLESWQIADGVGFAWIRGLSGATEVAPDQLRRIMDETYKIVKKEKLIAFHLLQVPGLMRSHAWLVVDMTEVPGGYDLAVVDSNNRDIRVVEYRHGMTRFERHYNGVPFLQARYNNEARFMIRAGREFCRRPKFATKPFVFLTDQDQP